MKSLSRRFLVSVGVMSLIVTVLGTLGTFLMFQRELSHRQIAFLQDYVRERSSNVERRFSNLTALHSAAGEELARRMEHLSEAEADRLADVYFPRRPDGTRRSRDEWFDGRLLDGKYVYGMGAMIARADALTPDETRALVAAFELVSGFGQAAHKDYDNFYFFTPPQTRLVMFGPDRPDRLMFYRHKAPADLDLTKEEMSSLTSPQNDPQRLTRCTNLQRLVQDKAGDRLATACLTPAYVDGRYVGAFGSSIELSGFMENAIRTPLPGATALLVTAKADLIAYPGFALRGKAAEQAVRQYEERLDLKALVKAIQATGKTSGVVDSPNGQDIVAFGQLAGPDWYLMMSYPKAAVAASAARSAAWLLLVGGVATALQVLLVVFLARREIVEPLARLAASCEDDGACVEVEAARNDEIGVLARSLRSEREKTIAVMASLEDRVAERTAQLERANAEKSRFLANMSHELRTPLNGVIAISDTLAREQATPKGKELAELIVASGRLLERVLTDILDFSKIEAGEIKLARDEFAMTTLVSRIAELHRASAEAKGLDFRWSVAPEADRLFAGDTVRLTQVLSNLLSNAVKFTEAGEVRLEVDTTKQGALRFRVTDSGIGFDEAVRQRLFRRFEQADDSIRRRFGGTGLGLAISRSLIELMGGFVEVASAPGQGSTFSVYVRLETVEGAPIEIEEDPYDDFDISGARVLLAEDHPTNQKVVQLVLDSVGIEPVIVENGALALEALAAGPFDVVLMDMQMPEMDGLTATAALRARERELGLPRTPVIMLTANALDEHVKASVDAGADMHLSKPIRPDVLIEAIMQAMAGGMAAAEAGDAAA